MREPLHYFTLCISENNPEKYYDRYSFEKSKISLQGAPVSSIPSSLMAFMEAKHLQLVSDLTALTTGLHIKINALMGKSMSASEMREEFKAMKEEAKQSSDKFIEKSFDGAAEHLEKEVERLEKEVEHLEKEVENHKEDPKPDIWDDIVSIWRKGIGMVLAAWAKSWDCICQAAKDVADFFVGVWNSVKHAMVKAGEWIEGAAQNVKDFFKTLV